MIIQLVQAIKVNDRWFKEGQQYLYSGKHYGTEWCYITIIDDVEWYIPIYACALLKGDTPSADMRSNTEKLEDYVIRDPVPDLLGKNDVVLAAKEFLGIEIQAKPIMDQADYDQAALAELMANPRYPQAVVPDRKVGVNETVTDQDIPLPDIDEFDNRDIDKTDFS